MTVAVAILGVLVVLLAVFVLALLRSHAEILRRLAAMEHSLDHAGVAASGGAGPGVTAAATGMPVDPTTAHGAAVDISGQTPDGDALKLALKSGTPPTLLAFMGTGCHSCAPLWQGLADGAVPAPAGARVVVITKDPERERLARLLELAPTGADVLMSSAAYAAYAVPSTPHFVLVQGGQITGRGAATSWQQITDFLTDAADDDRIYRSRSLGTDDRAARAESALAQAGIGPDHPSLYPSSSGSSDDDE